MAAKAKKVFQGILKVLVGEDTNKGVKEMPAGTEIPVDMNRIPDTMVYRMLRWGILRWLQDRHSGAARTLNLESATRYLESTLYLNQWHVAASTTRTDAESVFFLFGTQKLKLRDAEARKLESKEDVLRVAEERGFDNKKVGPLLDRMIDDMETDLR